LLVGVPSLASLDVVIRAATIPLHGQLGAAVGAQLCNHAELCAVLRTASHAHPDLGHGKVQRELPFRILFVNIYAVCN